MVLGFFELFLGILSLDFFYVSNILSLYKPYAYYSLMGGETKPCQKEERGLNKA